VIIGEKIETYKDW